jgi:hypothetical protein
MLVVTEIGPVRIEVARGQNGAFEPAIEAAGADWAGPMRSCCR